MGETKCHKKTEKTVEQWYTNYPADTRSN